MSYQKTRIRRDALPGQVDALLSGAKVGTLVHLTVVGVPSDVVVTELTPEWVQFETVPEVDLWRPAHRAGTHDDEGTGR